MIIILIVMSTGVIFAESGHLTELTMAFFLRSLTCAMLILESESVFICDNGHCDIDCNTDDCDIIICTNEATSCMCSYN